MPRPAWLLLKCSHPEPVFAVTAAVGVLAWSAGRGGSTFWAVAAVLAGQLGIGWMNDVLDVDLDRRAGRTDKPIVRGLVPARRVRLASWIALAVCIPLSLANGLAAGAVHVFAVGIAAAYNRWLKSTPLSFMPYAVAFGLVPAFVTLGLQPGHLPPAWATVGAALLGAGAHFVQVLPDIEAERRLGVRALPHLLGRRASTLVAAALIAGSALAILLGPGHPAELQLVALALVLALVVSVMGAGLAGRGRLAFRLTLAAAGAIALLFVLGGRSLG